MRSRPRLASAVVALMAAILLAGMLAGCGRARPIPPGAQEVHVVVTASEVRLDPAIVGAGDVYVVLDTPGSSVGFAQRKRTAAETPGPLSDDDLDRLGHGDTEGFAIGGMGDVGCSAAQRAEDHGQLGPCGNVVQMTLTAGKYAFFTGDLESGVDPPVIAVLEVLP